MSPGSPVRALLARLSPKVRVMMLVSVLLGGAARVSVVLAAVSVVDGRVAEATAFGVLTVLSFAVTRVIRTVVSTASECDLYRSVTRSWLSADVLSVPVTDPARALFEGAHRALSLVSEGIPALVSDAAALLVIAPILTSVLPPRALFLALVGAAALLLCFASVRSVYARLSERVASARQHVVDLVLTSIEGRLELVMRGGEAPHMEKLEAGLGAYRRVARRAAVFGALLGRAPIAAGVAMITAVVLFDGAARETVASVLVGQSLILAACVQPLLGAVLGANEIVRSRAELEPLLGVLDAPPRPELGRAGAPPPPLPTEIRVERATFRYGPEGPPALRAVDVAWAPSSPLVLVGPNGAGKSTMLYLLGGVRAPDEGVVRAAGQDLRALELRAFRENIAYLPQRPYLGEPHGSVRAAMLQAAPEAEDAAMLAVLARVGVLDALAARARDPLAVRVGELSAGQRQRVALARILLQDARMVLLDEPDANLDRAGVALVSDVLRELTAAGIMVAVAAHTPELTEGAVTRVLLERAT